MSSSVIDFMIDNRVDDIFFGLVFLLFFIFSFIASLDTGVQGLPSIFIDIGFQITLFLILYCVLEVELFVILIILSGNEVCHVGLISCHLRA